MKLVTIGKDKKSQSFKGTKANCIPLHYYNHKRTWMDKEIFENWFNKHFVLEVWASLKERGLPQKEALLLDKSPSHTRERILTSDSGLIGKFLPSIDTTVI